MSTKIVAAESRLHPWQRLARIRAELLADMVLPVWKNLDMTAGWQNANTIQA